MTSSGNLFIRRALVVLAVLLACGVGAGGALASSADGLRFFADLGGKPGTYEVIQVRATHGTLRWLSFRAVRDVRVTVRRQMEGKVVGGISVNGVTTKLRLPQGASRLTGHRRRVTLARVAQPRPQGPLVVILHIATTFRGAGGPVVPSVFGLPAGSTDVSIGFDGAGRGLLGPPHGCPVKPTLRLYAVRAGAAPVTLDDGVRCS